MKIALSLMVILVSYALSSEASEKGSCNIKVNALNEETVDITVNYTGGKTFLFGNEQPHEALIDFWIHLNRDRYDRYSQDFKSFHNGYIHRKDYHLDLYILKDPKTKVKYALFEYWFEATSRGGMILNSTLARCRANLPN